MTTHSEMSQQDRARRTADLIHSASEGTAVIDWPYSQEVYRLAVSNSHREGRPPVFGDLIRARREVASGPPADDVFKAGLRAASETDQPERGV